jgi:hypothetical protein
VECADLSALWSAATCRSLLIKWRRQAGAEQSGVKPPHSKKKALHPEREKRLNI